MTNLILDLWQDLRERRLLPVAGILAVALVATPVLLLKRTPTNHASAATTAMPSAPPPLVATASLTEPSTLREFDSKNPFRTLQHGGSTSSTTNGSAGNPFDAGASAQSGGQSVSAGSASAGPGASSGTTNSIGSPGGSGGGQSPGGGSNGARKKSKRRNYTYALDLTLRHGSNTRTFRRFPRLGLLPSARRPLVVFLGVTSRGDNALFLLDGTLRSIGEGRCKPRADKCSFLYLGAGEQQRIIDADGHSYLLRLDQIRRVPVGAAARSTMAGAKPARARLTHISPDRLFVPPMLVDLVEMGDAQ